MRTTREIQVLQQEDIIVCDWCKTESEYNQYRTLPEGWIIVVVTTPLDNTANGGERFDFCSKLCVRKFTQSWNN